MEGGRDAEVGSVREHKGWDWAVAEGLLELLLPSKLARFAFHLPFSHHVAALRQAPRERLPPPLLAPRLDAAYISLLDEAGGLHKGGALLGPKVEGGAEEQQLQ